MDALLATSFDRYARYSYVAALRRAWFDAPIRILDVGDPYGTLSEVFPGDDTVSLDLFADGAPVSGRHAHVIGSGFALPFPDGSFDLVASHDVYEHLPAAGRTQFVAELLRVGRGPGVLVAPFADPRTARCEAIVNAYYVARTGSTLEPLDEHVADSGLPPLDDLVAFLDGHGVAHTVHSDGWLYHWLAMMLLKAHCVAEGDWALDHSLDTTFNVELRAADRRGPHYRRAVVLRPAGPEPDLPGPPPPLEGVDEDLRRLTSLGWDLAARLPRASDPTLAGTPLREWVSEHIEESGDTAELARSLSVLLDGAAQLLDGPLRRTEEARRWPSVTLIVLAREGDSVEATRSQLEAQEYDGELSVRVAGAGGDVDVPAGADDVVMVNTAAAETEAECIAVLDSRVRVGTTWLRSLVDAYDPGSGALCVGSPAHDEQPGEALAPHREAFLIERNLYRNLGGLDGSLRGQGDDFDLGWRVWVVGARVLLAGERVDLPARGDLSLARLVALVKNAEDRTLRAALAPAIVASAAERGAPPDVVSRATALLPAALEARGAIQGLRRRGDGELFGRFALLTEPEDHRDADSVERLRAALGAPPHRVVPRVCLLAGGDRRDLDRARSLREVIGSAADVAVVVAPDALLDGELPWRSDDEAAGVAVSSDLVVVPASLLARVPSLLDVPGTLVADLSWSDVADDRVERVLSRADAFLVATEAQRVMWLGRIAGAGRADASRPATDSLAVVAPLRPPEVRSTGAAPPGFDDGRAVAVIGSVEDLDLGLAVAAHAELGGDRTVLWVATNRIAFDAVRERAASGGVGESVFLVDLDAASEEDLDALASRALVGLVPARNAPHVRAGPSSPAARFLAAGVPVITTTADPLADLVVATRSGGVVAPGDASGAARVVASLVNDRAARADASARAREASSVERWRAASASVVRLAASPWSVPRADGRLDDVAARVRAFTEPRDRAIEERDAEISRLRAQLGALEALVAHQQRRLDLLKYTPAYPAYRIARRLRRWATDPR